MTPEKFNPIAQLPTLPGAEIANDDLQTSIIDATYPPIDAPKDKMKPQIEIRVKPAQSTETTDDAGLTTETRRLMLVRITILISLIVLVFAGILLTLQLVPKIMSGIPDFNQSFTYLFTDKHSTSSTSTKNTIPTYVPLVASSTPIVTTYVPPVVTQEPTVSEPILTNPKTPAKIVANIISNNTYGNQTVVRFNTQNIGGSTSGVWSFSASLPSTVNPHYYSVAQSPLTSKSGIINTLTFTTDIDLPITITIYQ